MSKIHYLLIATLLVARPVFSDTQSPSETESKALTKRPQEPALPYLYDEHEVSFTNTADGVTLSGTLTLPRSQGPFPTVILLHGSAPLDRNHPICGHKTFLVLADYLTRQDIAVLRYDKRGAGRSAGNYDTSTIQDFAGDAIAGVEYLKTRKEIDSSKIGLIGCSEGGMTAPLAASKSKDIAFIVLMAGPGVNGEDLMDVQLPLLQRADGVDEETIAESRKLLKQMFATMKEHGDRELAAKRLREVLTKKLEALPPSQRKTFEAYCGTIDDQIKMFNSVSFRYYLTYEPAHALKQVKIPVLALGGAHDLQVCSRQNLPIIEKVLSEAGHKDYTIMELPKLNHLLQTCQTGSVKEFAAIEETIAPSALHIMSSWILERTAKK